MWLGVEGEEPVCFATCEGEVLWAPGQTEVADATTIYKIEMIAKMIARGTPGCTKRSVKCNTVKGVHLDADNGADDVRAMLDDCRVLFDRVDKLHCTAVEPAEASEGSDV